MVKRTDIDQARFRALKIARSAIRLKHSLAADDELNEKLSELQKAFDVSVRQGWLPDEAGMRELVSRIYDV